jgi:hypothetical protein
MPSLFDLLPEVYRRRGGERLERYVRVAQEMLDDLARRRDHAASTAPRLTAAFGPSLAAGGGGAATGVGARASSSLAGTLLGVARWLEPGLPRPGLWNGRQVRPLGRGRIEVVRASGRAAVLAWGRRELEESPGDGEFADFELPEWLLPAALQLQAVLLDAPRPPGPPLPGSRLPGEILYSSAERRQSGPQGGTAS